MKYLASESGKKNVKGMVSISNPWNVYKSANSLNTFSNLIYSKYMTKQIYNKAFFNKTELDKKKIVLDWKQMKAAKTTFEFD